MEVSMFPSILGTMRWFTLLMACKKRFLYFLMDTGGKSHLDMVEL